MAQTQSLRSEFDVWRCYGYPVEAAMSVKRITDNGLAAAQTQDTS